MENCVGITPQQEADKIDEKIIYLLERGKNFRVEAGAGSGKTYSLIKVVEWLQANKAKEYKKKWQEVACITFTNAAADVIQERLPNESFIVPSTIHGFAWGFMKQFRGDLVKAVKQRTDIFKYTEDELSAINDVQYTLGHRFLDNNVLYLHHDDVIALFSHFLEFPKFRLLLSKRYPLILIDEYQDSMKTIMDKFVAYFIQKDEGIQFGLFGDSWQTIYRNTTCGLVEDQNLEVVEKTINFRSAKKIVDALNVIRPSLPQKSTVTDFPGEVIVIYSDDYTGPRRNDGHFKDDLPAGELKKRLENIKDVIKVSTPENEELKTLMLTHKILAKQQGYEKLLDILGEGLKEKEDPILIFVADTVEQVYKSLVNNDTTLLLETLKIRRYPITKKSDKRKWLKLQADLGKARGEKLISVLAVVADSRLVPIPQKVNELYQEYYNNPEGCYMQTETLIKDVMEMDYDQFRAASEFLSFETSFSTDHGTKGEEYDNVLFVISKGWHMYKFDKYVPMNEGRALTPNERESYERNRNLFYVCCSRAKKRLYILITYLVGPDFKNYLEKLAGKENCVSYTEFLKLGVRQIN